jgi:hypothetical protein
MVSKGNKFVPLFRWAFYGAIALIAISLTVLHLRRGPPPPNSAAFGCYVTADAAPIRLDRDGMSIMQTDIPTIPYHLERHKTGIALTADAPIQAKPSEGRYSYSRYWPGGGWYLNFYKEKGHRRDGVFDETQLSRFTMLARDGKELSYEKARSEKCQTRTP